MTKASFYMLGSSEEVRRNVYKLKEIMTWFSHENNVVVSVFRNEHGEYILIARIKEGVLYGASIGLFLLNRNIKHI